jgi:hypothetical protein
MSEENVEIALQQVEAVNRQDADAFVATVSLDVEWEDAVFWSEVSRTYRGRAAVSRRGPPGSLIADMGPGHLLRILRSETPVGSAGDGFDATLWIVAGIGTIALVLASRSAAPSAASIMRLTATALDEKQRFAWKRWWGS